MSSSSHLLTAELFADIAYAFTVQPDGNLLPEWISGAVEALTGYTAEELTSRTIFDLVHPDDETLLTQHRACFTQTRFLPKTWFVPMHGRRSLRRQS